MVSEVQRREPVDGPSQATLTSACADRTSASAPSAEGAVYCLFGFAFGVDGAPAARRLLSRLYGPYARSPDLPGLRFRLDGRRTGRMTVWRALCNDHLLFERRSLGAALRRLEYDICCRMLVARPDLVVLHSATLEATGGAALISGPSGAGKSTLALALAARGYRLGGDDLAFLDAAARLHPLPRCAHLDARSRRLLRQAGLRLPSLAVRHGFVTPADVSSPAYRGGSLRFVLILSRGDARTPCVTPVSQAEAALCLAREAGWTEAAPSHALTLVMRAVAGAACYRIIGGRLAETVAAVAALLGPARCGHGPATMARADAAHPQPAPPRSQQANQE